MEMICLAVAPNPDKIYLKYLWDLETRYTELKLLEKTSNSNIIYLSMGMILKCFFTNNKEYWNIYNLEIAYPLFWKKGAFLKKTFISLLTTQVVS